MRAQAFQGTPGISGLPGIPSDKWALYDCASPDCSTGVCSTVTTVAWSVPWKDHIPRNAFGNCASLTSITGAEGVSGIGDGAFYGSGLRSFAWPPGPKAIKATTFYGCSSLTSITGLENVDSVGMQGAQLPSHAPPLLALC